MEKRSWTSPSTRIRRRPDGTPHTVTDRPWALHIKPKNGKRVSRQGHSAAEPQPKFSRQERETRQERKRQREDCFLEPYPCPTSTLSLAFFASLARAILLSFLTEAQRTRRRGKFSSSILRALRGSVRKPAFTKFPKLTVTNSPTTVGGSSRRTLRPRTPMSTNSPNRGIILPEKTLAELRETGG